MEYYPDNTVARYTTKLADKIELEGHWEVGLAEISVPSAVQNIVRGQYYYSIYVNDVHIRTIDLPSRHHKRIRTLVDAMHVEQRRQVPLQTHEPLLVEFSYFDSKISIKLHQPLRRSIQSRLRSHAGSRRRRQVFKYSHNMTAKRTASLATEDIHSMYVYCDILEHVAVGDTKAPLLRIVDKPKRQHGNVHQIFNPILYVPLQKKNSDTVEINIMTDIGVPIPFRFGKAFVVLEFRRAYFGL